MKLTSHISKIYHSDNERTALIKKNILGTIMIKGISIPTSLLLVPLTIHYISSELYGIWLTLTSIIAWVGFFDIGFGNGLRNKLTEALAKGNVKLGRNYVSTTYAFLSIIFVITGIICYIIIPMITWHKVLNTSPALEDQIVTVMRIVIVFFCIQMILKVQTSVWMAMQLNAIASAADAFGQVVTLIGIWILTKTTFPSLTNMAYVYNGCTTIVLVIMSFILYRFKNKALCPSITCINKQYAKDILNLGGKFFIIQIAAIITFQTTNVIMSYSSGPESVTEYNVIYKYMNVANMIMGMILAPIWSAFTDAYTKGDSQWMSNIYKRLKQIFYIVVLVLILMVAIYPPIFKLWLGNSVKIHLEMVILVAIYVITTIWASIHSNILNGIGKITFSLWFCNIQIILTIPLTLILGHYFGAEGVLLGIILITLPSMFTSPYQVIHLLKGDAKGIWNK